MGKSRVKGIVVKIGGDTVGLNKALDGTNKKINSTQKNLKDVERLLKMDPKNTVLLEQKQRLLAEAVSAAEAKLQKLNEANDQVKDSVKNYDAFAEAVKPVNEQIDTAKKKLKELKEQKEKLEQAEDVDTEEFEKLTEAIEETEDQLKKLRTQKKEVSAAFGDPIPQESFDDLQREIIETETELERLKEQHKAFGNIAAQVMAAAGQEISQYGEKVEKAGKKVTDAGMKLAPVTAAITAAGVAAVNAGSDMVESQNKVEVAFGAAADRIKDFSDTTLDAFGIAKGTALEMASLYGDMATSMEVPQDAAAEMSETLVGLAGDLASYKNAELDTVQNALKGIFTGETESLKNLGVVMTQDQLLNFALQRGMIDTSKSAAQLADEELKLEKAKLNLEEAERSCTEALEEYGAASLEARQSSLALKEAQMELQEAENALSAPRKASLDDLSQAQLVYLRYEYVLNSTKNAQGDFSRNSDEAANSMRTATEAAKEAAAGFGILLAPVVAEVAQIITDLLKAVNDLPDGTKEVIRPGGKFCVSVFRQNQEYHVINVHDGAYSPWLQLSRKVGEVCAPCTA
ncbi:MAG: hypothetical protein IKA47_11495 [Oscillospiraceae bacterium]|nr:hypothetical protein [Oscillospiraceae bacterium]MBR2422013.1 hypothetical protein [Oscillospiraceae bacterium]